MIRRKPKAISAFELRRLSVVLFVSTQRQGSSKYLLKKEINTALRNGHWVPVVTYEDTETNFTASGACSYL